MLTSTVPLNKKTTMIAKKTSKTLKPNTCAVRFTLCALIDHALALRSEIIETFGQTHPMVAAYDGMIKTMKDDLSKLTTEAIGGAK